MRKQLATKLGLSAAMVLTAGVFMGMNVFAQESAIDPNQEYTITFWDINSSETDSKYKPREKALNEMAELYPNITVETSYFQDLPYREKLPVAAAANELPDFFFNWVGGTTDALVSAGQVLDLTTYEDELVPMWEDAAAASCYADGKLYYMPSVMQAYMMYCNVDLLSEYGLSVPETYDDLLNIISVLSENGVNAMTAGGKDHFPIAILQEIFDLRLAGSEMMLKQAYGEESFDTDITVQSAQLMADLYANGGLPKNILSMDSNDAFAQFTIGKAAMMFGGNWNSGMLDAADLPFEVKVINFPSIEGEIDPNAMLGGPCDIYMINSEVEYPEVVIEWTKEFMKRFTKYQVEDGGCIGGWKVEDIDSTNIGPITQQQNELFTTATDMIRNWDILIDYETALNVYTKIEEVLVGQSDVAAFGADMESIVRE